MVRQTTDRHKETDTDMERKRDIKRWGGGGVYNRMVKKIIIMHAVFFSLEPFTFNQPPSI